MIVCKGQYENDGIVYMCFHAASPALVRQRRTLGAVFVEVNFDDALSASVESEVFTMYALANN